MRTIVKNIIVCREVYCFPIIVYVVLALFVSVPLMISSFGWTYIYYTLGSDGYCIQGE